MTTNTIEQEQPYWEPDKELHRTAFQKYAHVIKNHPYAACENSEYEIDAMYSFLGFFGYLDFPCSIHVFKDMVLFLFYTQDVEENKRNHHSHDHLYY